MGLFNRKPAKPVNLASGISVERVSTSRSAEIGVAGNSVVGGLGDDEIRSDKRTIAEYKKMRDNDGTVASLYNILTLPILAASRRIVAADDDAGEEQADFVRQNLLEPPHQGGMEIPLSLLLADMLRAVLEGFRAYEKVWLLQDGKLAYRKLAIRDSETLTLRRGDDGGYDGLHQVTSFKGRTVDEVIPAEKSFLFTYGKDKDYLYGESAFKAAAFHYDLKHKFYYLSQIQAQARAIPPAIAQPGEGAESDPEGKIKKTVLDALSALGFKRSVAFIPKGIDAKPWDLGTGTMDMMPYIDHHDTQMARSVLAQMIMLGTTSESKGGSYALSSDHSDLFMIALQGVMKNIEEHFNFFVIPELHDLNFAKPKYSYFEFEEISGQKLEIIKAAFEKLLGSGSINEALVKGIEQEMAEALELDLDQLQKDLDKQKAKDAEEVVANAAKGLGPDGKPLPPAPVVPAPGVPVPDKKPEVKLSDQAAGDDPKGPDYLHLFH